ncbi:helix-turn-helix domain-containing protein [Ruegeria lacuscaerulensis]|uniref:helix-turn-helix domain-containing protein n=1 Tax=Ruegeria lacuscaerulensis TaxID=55218 RepID=UPI00147E2968|nr:helix-turn-helix domain-containing protein [Ruegeria lacuscaerulensis]
MKHYVVHKDQANRDAVQPMAKRVRNIEVVLQHPEDKATVEPIMSFYRALNRLIEAHSYVVNLRILAEDKVGEPLCWTGRSVIFWGDHEQTWHPIGSERLWVAQVLNLAPRTMLVGGAVMLLMLAGGSGRKLGAVHPGFQAGAAEQGLESCGTSTHLSATGRLHSANSRISSLRLLARFVSIDHGEHIADVLRKYIGLEEPTRGGESQVVNRLVRRSGGDELVIHTLKTMLETIEDPLSISDLSKVVGTSTRQLQRRYLCKTGTKLLDTYKELRLERVHCLLRHTDLPFSEVAIATGFSSRVAMSRAFFKHYRSKPEDSRKQRYLGSLDI